MIKKLAYALKDWHQLYIQMFDLIAILILGIYMFFHKPIIWLINLLQPYKEQLTDNILILFIIASQSEYTPYLSAVFYVIFFWYVMNKIRIRNKTYILNGANGTSHRHIHSYPEYWLAYHLLGVQQCQLTYVPIPMQFKIILLLPFSQYLYKDGVQDINKENRSLVVIKRIGEMNDDNNEMNLVLSDTYPIDLEKQLPKAAERKTLSISRFSNDFTRVHSRKFVASVLNEVKRLPPTVKVLHVYATLNPWNTYEIVTEVFKTGGRDNLDRLYVYDQSSENGRPFTEAEQISLR